MLNQFKTTLVLVSLTLISLHAQAATYPEQPGDWHYGFGWGWGHMVFGSLMMILFWGGIILAIVLGIRSTQSRDSDRKHTDKSPLNVLDERFARGEIDKEEYEEKKKLLSR